MRNRRASLAIGALACVWIGWSCIAQVSAWQLSADLPIRDPRLDQLAERLVNEHRLPGLVCGYFPYGQAGHVGAAGVRAVGSADAISAGDLVHIGSCTKAMTATLAAIAVQEGKLRWDSTIGEVLPDLADAIDPDYVAVTLRQLLDHRGSVPANVLYPRIPESEDPRPVRSQVIESGLRKPPSVAPGSKFQYSNFGYVVIGHMLERCYDLPWETLIRERIFQPLGIDEADAGFGPPRSDQRLDQPAGHRRNRDGSAVVSNTDNSPVLGPAGRVHITLPAWARFCQSQWRDDSAGELLSAETIQVLQTDGGGESHYAGGWILGELPGSGDRILTHTGSNTVWTATALVVPAHECVYLLATNISDRETAAMTVRAVRELVRLREDDAD